MTPLRARVVLTTLVGACVIGLVVANVPDHSPADRAVGTEGGAGSPGRHAGDHAADKAPATGDTPTADTASDAQPRDLIAAEPRAVTGSPATTTPGEDPSGDASTQTTTVTTAPRVPTGPHDLLGRIAFIDSATSAIWSMRPDGTDRRREVACPDRETFHRSYVAVSPDGTQLLRPCQVATTSAGQIVGRHQLLVQNVDGTEDTVIFESGSGSFPVTSAWTDNGRSIVVKDIAQNEGYVMVDVSTGSTRRITVPASNPGPEVHAWSPDGTHLVLPGLRLVDLRTGAIAELVPDQLSPAGLAYEVLSTWSPDGAWIYYVQTGGYDVEANKYRNALNRVEVATGNVEELVPWTVLDGALRSNLGHVVFATDGSVLFLGGTDLWTMDADGGNRRLLDPNFPGHSLSAPSGRTR